MKRSIAIVCAIMMVVSPAAAQTWTASAGWSYTSLGAPQPDGYGTTGGNTALVSLRRSLARPAWGSLDASAIWRGYGFEQDGARTVGIEMDAGLIASRRVVGLGDNAGLVWLGASVGGYRSPFATAIGRYRWFGVRPSFDLGLRITAKDGWTVDASCNVRRYDVLVWSGWSVSAAVLGGWSW